MRSAAQRVEFVLNEAWRRFSRDFRAVPAFGVEV
jgi:hypothetical protein